MKADEFLKKLDKNDEIFNEREYNEEYEYTEDQLFRFAELYHKRMVILTRFDKKEEPAIYCKCGNRNYNPTKTCKDCKKPLPPY